MGLSGSGRAGGVFSFVPVARRPGWGRRHVLWGKLGSTRLSASRRRFKETRRPNLAVPPGLFFSSLFISLKTLGANLKDPLSAPLPRVAVRAVTETQTNEKTTLGGGSLGSCVDEERSQLRELM